MGMNKRSHVTNGVQVLALDLASMMPYRRSADVLRKTSAIELTHQTIWRLVAKAADAIMEAADAGLKVIICITEGIPVNDMMKAFAFVKQKGALKGSFSGNPVEFTEESAFAVVSQLT